MVKVVRRGDVYIFYTWLPPYKFQDIHKWCGANHIGVGPAPGTGNGTAFTIEIRQATDERLAHLLRVLCQTEVE